MAMRTCIYCHADISYDRDTRDAATGGAVGFWRDAVHQEAGCPSAPADAQGRQLHAVGDIHTPPSNPEDLEAFLNGTYVPQPPAEPCGSVFGMSEKGDILNCGLDKDHDGPCEPGTAVENPTPPQVTNSPTPVFVEVKVENTSPTGYKVTAVLNKVEIVLEFDTATSKPQEVEALLESFPMAAVQAIGAAMGDLLGDDEGRHPDPEEQQAPTKAAPPEDPDDIERFLNGE